MTDNDTWFGRFAKHGARWTGRPVAFGVAVTIVLIWAVTGPLFGFSDTWQLVIKPEPRSSRSSWCS